MMQWTMHACAPIHNIVTFLHISKYITWGCYPGCCQDTASFNHFSNTVYVICYASSQSGNEVQHDIM